RRGHRQNTCPDRGCAGSPRWSPGSMRLFLTFELVVSVRVPRLVGVATRAVVPDDLGARFAGLLTGGLAGGRLGALLGRRSLVRGRLVTLLEVVAVHCSDRRLRGRRLAAGRRGESRASEREGGNGRDSRG